METFQRLEWLLWSGPVICTHHRNLTYIFNPQTAVLKKSKATSQRLLNWATSLEMLKFSIRHTVGTENLRSDLLSRWMSAPVCTRSLAVRAPFPEIPNLDGEIGRNANSLPSVDVIQGVQIQYTSLQADDGSGFPTSSDLDDGNLVSRRQRRVYSVRTGALWIPEDVKYLQLRLLVCAHCGKAGRRGKDAATDRRRHASTGRERTRTRRHSSMTALTAWIPAEGEKSRAPSERPPTELI